MLRRSTAENLTSGLVVPQVNTAADAQSVVASAKFPPHGFRGQGSPFPGIAHGVDIATYVRTANESVVICLQIESKQGVENVEAICAVPGVGK
jgi:4-hydroxy-2-oxoheptanedioate aldolase